MARRTLELTEQGQRNSAQLTEQGQVTERYAKAIEQLGSNQTDVRIGGIYALERIARDSPEDHPTVMEVLTTFVREHSAEQREQQKQRRQQRLAQTPIRKGAWSREQEQTRVTKADSQAAVTVIGRRNPSQDRQRIDLGGAFLEGADFAKANLAVANLTVADLRSANLLGANLANADLVMANLVGAILDGADMTGANLMDAELNPAVLYDRIPVPADFTGANLEGVIWNCSYPPPPGWQKMPDGKLTQRE